MKKYLLSLSIMLVGNMQSRAQECWCEVQRFYAACSDSIGSFYLQNCSADASFLWSTGDTTDHINVPPGNYSVTIKNNLTGDTCVRDSLMMWHDTWDLDIADMGTGSMYIHAQLPSCKTSIYTHPSCYPWDKFLCIIWEDSVVAKDTIVMGSCSFATSYWCCMQPGHRYDVSIYDPSCSCYQSTAMYSPSRSIYFQPTSIKEKVSITDIKITNPFHEDLKIEIESEKNLSCDIQLSDVAGRLIVRNLSYKLVAGKNQYRMNTSTLSEGVYIIRIGMGGNSFIYKLIHL